MRGLSRLGSRRHSTFRNLRYDERERGQFPVLSDLFTILGTDPFPRFKWRLFSCRRRGNESICQKQVKRLTKTDFELLAAFRFALRQFLQFSESAATQAGVTAKQYQALLAIKGFPDRDHVTISELAKQLQVRHHSAVGLADRLVARKLVARQTSAADRRQVYLRLTVRGERVLGSLAAAHREQLHRIGSQLTRLVKWLDPQRSTDRRRK